MTDAGVRVGQAASEVGRAQRRLRVLRRRAGRAANNPDSVNAELTEAIDVFAAGNWSELSLAELAQAAGRIERLARSLVAASQLPDAERYLSRAHNELRDARLALDESEAAA